MQVAPRRNSPDHQKRLTLSSGHNVPWTAPRVADCIKNGSTDDSDSWQSFDEFVQHQMPKKAKMPVIDDTLWESAQPGRRDAPGTGGQKKCNLDMEEREKGFLEGRRSLELSLLMGR